LISRDKEHNPNLELSPADADDIDAEDSLVAEEASLLQAVEVQAEPVAERQRLLPKFKFPSQSSKYGRVLIMKHWLTLSPILQKSSASIQPEVFVLSK